MVQRPPQLFQINGFSQVLIHSGFRRLLTVVGKGIRGHGYNRNAFGIVSLYGPDFPGRGAAIHHRHLHIHKNQIEGVVNLRLYPLNKFGFIKVEE